MSQKVLDALTAMHSQRLERTASANGDEVAWVKREHLVEVATCLRDDPQFLFDSPVFCTCIDWLDWHPAGRPPSEHWSEDKPRFTVCYQLRSVKLRHRIRLEINVTEADPRLP